jgi:hypothetical protein
MLNMSEALNEQKDVEFHSQSINAWYASALEYDRSLLTLSTGATGLLITLLTTKEITSLQILILCIIALLCFIGAIVVLLAIFRRNQKHILKVLNGQDDDDPLLTYLDIGAIALFGGGILLSGIIGTTVALASFDKGKTMAKQLGEHEAMAHALKNEDLHRRSMNGLGAVRRTAIGGTTPQSQQPTPPASSTPSSDSNVAPQNTDNGESNRAD